LLSPKWPASVELVGRFIYGVPMTQDTITTDFVVRKDRLTETRLRDRPQAALIVGQVRLAIESFALTANNITYARFGDAMHYWDFFPTGEEGWGAIPVWGFAHVCESRCEGIAVGEKLYGYFPMASQLVVEPARIKPESFFDGAAHRQSLPLVYNQLIRCAADPFHAATGESGEHVQSLLRPLFITSFLIDDFLADNDFFGAGEPGSKDGQGATLLLSSASSKTAYGTAFQLAQRPGVQVVALTSAGNVGFCESLGCYSRVLAYDQIGQLARSTPCVYVDFAGSASLRHTVHSHFEQLKYSCSIGGTQFEARSEAAAARAPGPKATLFFAPAQIKKRSAEWGAKALEARLLSAWQGFTTRVTHRAAPWLVTEVHNGASAIEGVYREALAGGGDPRVGHIIAF
jgi:Protein of unknown function (DUF2855)